VNSAKKGIFVHGAHKSGTEFLRYFFKELCALAGIKPYTYDGYKETTNTADKIVKGIDHSFCFCPVRTFRFENIEDPYVWGGLQTEPKCKSGFDHIADSSIYHIVQMRDVRDIIVSQYFSFGWSHSVPNRSNTDSVLEQRAIIRKRTIDEYAFACFRQAEFSAKLEAMQRLDDLDLNIMIVKYEDMVLDFRKWLKDVVKVFELTNESEVVQRLYEQHEAQFRPFPEDPTKHKRKMIPGDYKEKLKPETIELLNKKLQWQTKYGYDMS
jgi:hypothetical protein